MRKVLMYSTSELFGNRVTGGLRRFLELYSSLKKQGIDVELYSGDSNEILRKNNIKGYTVNRKKSKNNLYIPEEIRILINNISIIKKIKKNKFDSVIVFDVPTAIGLCIMNIENIQLFIRQDLISYKKISLQSRTKNKLFIYFYLKLMHLCEVICILKVKNIFIQCKYDYFQLIKRHILIKSMIKKKSIIQINNLNPSWIEEKSKSDSEIQLNNKDKFTVGFIGDFSNDRKGQRIFIDAVKSLLNKKVKINAIVVGDGAQLKLYKEECKLYSDIQFMGRMKNPIEIIKKCDLMVVPSLADSCPNTVMESLYNNVAVIGSNAGGIPEILDDDEALFETNSVSLQNKIEYLLVNKNLKLLLEKQRKRSEELNFDWGMIIGEIINKDINK